jgi:hypothetical protein
MLSIALRFYFNIRKGVAPGATPLGEAPPSLVSRSTGEPKRRVMLTPPGPDPVERCRRLPSRQAATRLPAEELGVPLRLSELPRRRPRGRRDGWLGPACH